MLRNNEAASLTLRKDRFQEVTVKKYEGMFIFHATNNDQELDEKINNAGAEITRLGGVLGGVTRMGRSSFARPIKKKNAGVYVLMRFELDPLKVDSLRKNYRRNEDLLRVQVFLTAERAEAPATDAPAPADVPAAEDE